MLQLYQESVDYIASEMDFLGKKHPHLLDSQEARVLHFQEMLPHLEKNAKDAMQAQKALQKKTASFTDEQRHRMGMAISMLMKSSEVGPSGFVTKFQNHKYLESYMTEPMWRLAQDKTVDWDTKLERAADFMLQIGVPNPNDDTVKRAVSINALCHGATMTPEVAYEHVHLLRTKLVNKRQLKPCGQSMKEFPQDPVEFMRLHPRVYLDSERPIASRLDSEAIRQLMRKDVMPTRNTNKLIRSQAAASSSQSALATDVLRYILGGSASIGSIAGQLRGAPEQKGLEDLPRTRPQCQLPSTTVPSPAPLAILDGSVNGAPAVPAAI